MGKQLAGSEAAGNVMGLNPDGNTGRRVGNRLQRARREAGDDVHVTLLVATEQSASEL